MPIATYEIIHTSKLQDDIQRRYAAEIETLENLGFDKRYYVREIIFPFSAVLLFFLYPLMAHKREIFRIEWPFRYVLFNVLLTSSRDGTYAQIFGLGVKFHTRFIDGTLLISTPSDNTIINKDHRFYKYGVALELSLTVTQLWEIHCARIAEIEWDARGVDYRVSLQKFEEISEKDDRIQMGLDR